MSGRLRLSYEAESSSTYDYVLQDRGAIQAGEAELGDARQAAGRADAAGTKETAVADAGDKGESSRVRWDGGDATGQRCDRASARSL